MNGNPEVSPQRKLAAIMFTDMKGFSKKMEKDELTTMNLLRTHNEMMNEAVHRNSGSVVKTVGDAYLVWFESAVSAVKCAIEIQQGFFEHNKARPLAEQIIIRIGIHVGDIILEANDVFGGGVNIAARIQALAMPGGICISQDVVRQVTGRMDVSLLKLGRGELKNIKLPVTLYKVVLPWEKKSSFYLQRMEFVWKKKHTKHLVMIVGILGGFIFWIAMETSLFKEHYTSNDLTLAVMPFLNTGDQTNDYLSEGMTDDVIQHLTGDSSLLVVSQSSSFQFKDSNIPQEVIAKQLGVRFLLRGMLQMAGNSFKMRILLFDSKNEKDVWSQNFNVSRPQIFQIREAIVLQVSKFFGLSHSLSPGDERRISPQAYESYLHGLYYLRRNTKEDNRLAIDFFQETVSIDTVSLNAANKLGYAEIQFYDLWDKSPKLLEDALRNTQRIVRKDSNNADAYANLGYVAKVKGNPAQALEYYQRALEHDRHNLASMYELSVLYLLELNEIPKALKYLKMIQEIDPTSSTNWSNLGVAYGQLKNYSEAIIAFRRALELNPHDDRAWNNLGYVYERVEKLDSAMQCFRAAIRESPSQSDYYSYLVNVLLVTEHYAEAESVLVEANRLLPGDLGLLYTLGTTCTLAKKPLEAKRFLNEGLIRVRDKLSKNPYVAVDHSQAGLFWARLGNAVMAVVEADQAFKIDSTSEKVNINLARIYAVLRQKAKMLKWYRRAKSMNPEYDDAYLRTAIDFEFYRKDADLLQFAQQGQ